MPTRVQSFGKMRAAVVVESKDSQLALRFSSRSSYSESMQAPNPSRSRSLRFFALVGPGVLIAATGVGAGDLATAAISGSKLGLAVLWAALLGTFFKYVLTEGLARYQLASGETLLQGAMTRLGPVPRVLFGAYLLLWTFFVANSLMSAAGIALHAMLPVFAKASTGQIVFGALQSLVGLALVRWGGFAVFEKVMGVCIGVMFVVVLTTAVMLRPDVPALVRGLFIPSVPAEPVDSLQWTIALMGGIGGTLTVLCYGYWIREKDRHGPSFLSHCRIDLATGYVMTGLFGVAMVVIGTQIQVQGKGARLIVELAESLRGPMGPWGRWAFLLGAWGAIFSSLLGVWQSVPYVFTDYLGLLHTRKGEAPPEVRTSSRPYKAYLYAIALVPMLGLWMPFSQIQKVYAIFGAAFMPLLALCLLLLNGRLLPDAKLRSHWTTQALLVGILLFFAWAGYRGVR